jgi:hypothetical protein
MIFSPLQFMPPGEAIKCLTAILPDSKLQSRIDRREVASVDISFWPSGRRAASNNSDKMTSVVPDLEIRLAFTSGPSLLLVGEMKWESRLTSDQIKREREGAKKENPYIFVIVKNKGSHEKETLKCDALYSWKEINSNICYSNIRHDSIKYNSPSYRWAALVTEFLKLAEQLVFSGFSFDHDLINRLPTIDKNAVFFNRIE